MWTTLENSTELTCLPMTVLRRVLLEWVSGQDHGNGNRGLLVNLDKIGENLNDLLGGIVIKRLVLK